MKRVRNSDHDAMTPSDMRNWLVQEIRDVLKGQELRIKDATEFVTAYCLGEISAEEASRRFDLYTDRWGDAILGVSTSEDMTNAEVIKRRDQEILDRSKQTRAARLRDERMGRG